MKREKTPFVWLKNIIKKLHIWQVILLLLSLGVLFGLIYIIPFATNNDIEGLNSQLSKPTIIYDKNGEVASKVSANKNEGVAFEEIPESLIHAVIAIEDHRFFQHEGVDYQGIGRAFLTNIRAGRIVEGGSTITQQLVKNELLTAEKSYDRKLQEFFIAREVEHQYSKEEILQMYLNRIYFGEGAYGVKKAANKYFAKDLDELSLSESAMLAGLIKAPSAINPYNDKQKAIARKNLVLKQMKQHGYISEEEMNQAINVEMSFKEGEADPMKGKYPYYVDAVLEEAMNRYDLSLDELLTQGYQIYTELDPSMQADIESTYQNDAIFPSTTGERPVQSGMILMDPETGGIRALVGGRGEHTLLGHNRAIHPVGEPGSTMKPIIPYAAAIEAGWENTDMLKDEKLSFGEYAPNNYNNQYLGEVPMYEAVMHSINLPAVWLYNEIGIDRGKKMAEQFGIPKNVLDGGLALALGGTSRPVSPKVMAEAYSVFANGGKKEEAHTIIEIKTQSDEPFVQWESKKETVISEQTANQVTAMLLGVVDYGTGKAAKIDGVEIAGKTGSTQLGIEGLSGTKDQWFVGYTPHLVGAIWVGYDQSDRNHYLTTSSSEGTAPIFKEVMGKVLQGKPIESFNVNKIDDEYKKKQRNKEKKEQRDEIRNWLEDKRNQFFDWFN